LLIVIFASYTTTTTQSFYIPYNTLNPGMKFTNNVRRR